MKPLFRPDLIVRLFKYYQEGGICSTFSLKIDNLQNAISHMPGYEELEASFKKNVIEKTREHIPYWKLLGLELMDLKKGWARLRLPYSKKLANAGGIAHGGAVFSAADSAVGVALLGMTEKNESISTIEMKINYIKTFSAGDLLVEATIIHKGRNTALGEAQITDCNGKLIAKATATYAVIRQT